MMMMRAPRAMVRQIVIRAICCGLTTMLALSTLQANAGPITGQFNVTVNLETAPASCRTTNAPGSFGATVTVVCSSGAISETRSPLRVGAYRYLFQVSAGETLLGTIDSYAGVGTVTTWRVAHLANRDYLEMLVGW